MRKPFRFPLLLAICASPCVSAAQPVTLALNWTAGADQAPFYFAREKNWFRDAGLDLTIRPGSGSLLAVQQVSAGKAEFGVADLPTALVGRGRGWDLRAVMAVYVKSPQGFYWLRSSGISGPASFPGRKIGNPPGDAARAMWPAFARSAGLPPGSVRFVNISAQAKMAALRNGSVDIISDFYTAHDAKAAVFGPDLGYIAWRDVGLDLYGNALIANGAWLARNGPAARRFVAVTQRAYAQCYSVPEPCLDALQRAVTGIDRTVLRQQWGRVRELMGGPRGQPGALGAFDGARLEADYRIVQQTMGIGQPFDVRTVVTNDFLSPSVRLP